VILTVLDLLIIYQTSRKPADRIGMPGVERKTDLRLGKFVFDPKLELLHVELASGHPMDEIRIDLVLFCKARVAMFMDRKKSVSVMLSLLADQLTQLLQLERPFSKTTMNAPYIHRISYQYE
jgi:hypothetical protein